MHPTTLQKLLSKTLRDATKSWWSWPGLRTPQIPIQSTICSLHWTHLIHRGPTGPTRLEKKSWCKHPGATTLSQVIWTINVVLLLSLTGVYSFMQLIVVWSWTQSTMGSVYVWKQPFLLFKPPQLVVEYIYLTIFSTELFSNLTTKKQFHVCSFPACTSGSFLFWFHSNSIS